MTDGCKKALRIRGNVSFPSGAATIAQMDAQRSPVAVLAAAFAVGVVLAKWIDWRGHAHPRR